MRDVVEALAQRVPAGVLVVDERGGLALANAEAVEALGAGDIAQLRAQWPALWPQLSTAPPDAPLILPHGAAVRVETARSAAFTLALIVRVDPPGPLPRLVLEAARSRRQEQLAAGFLHDLNGPLNNFNLTLALLQSTLAKAARQAPSDALLQRAQRQLEMLDAETRRLLDWSKSMGAGLIAPEAAEPRTDLDALLRALARTLRHHAALHEVTIAVAPASQAIEVAAEPWRLNFALLHATSTLIAHSHPGGTIAIDTHVEGDTVDVRIAASASAWPRAIEAAQHPASLPDADDVDLAAARFALESLGGTSAVVREAHDVLALHAKLRCLSVQPRAV